MSEQMYKCCKSGASLGLILKKFLFMKRKTQSSVITAKHLPMASLGAELFSFRSDCVTRTHCHQVWCSATSVLTPNVLRG